MNVAKFTKNLFIVMVAMILIAILGRIFMMEDNDLLSELFATENAVAVYAEDPEEGFKYHAVADDLADDGYYSANGLIYIESKNELQITARYNDSLYTYLNTPDTTEFYYTLVDTSTENTYEGKVLDQGEKYMYNYEKLVFEGVEIGESSELYLFLHFEDKYPVEGETEGLLIHHADQTFKSYKLSKDEIAALGGEEK